MNISLENCQSICSLTSHSTVKHVNTMNIGLEDCQSVCSKCDDIADYVKDLNLNALVITDLTPDGYTFRPAQRTHRKGGRVGILYRDTLKT